MRYLVLFFTLLISTTAFAQTAKIKQLEQQRKKTLQEISSTDALLQNTKKTVSTILGRIALISKQITSRKEVLDLLNKEVDALDVAQKNIEQEIIVLEADLKMKQDGYAKAIAGMQARRQNQNKIIFVLSGKSLSESYRRFHYLRDFSLWVSEQAEDINEHKTELKEKESDLAKAKYDKVALLRQREREQEKLQKDEGNFQKEAGEVQKKQKDLQQDLTKKRKQAEALDKQIEKLIAEEVARQEREAKRLAEIERKKQEEKNKGKGTQGTTGTTPTKPAETTEAAPATSIENLKLSKNFAANKGKLPLPITGTPRVTGKFGTHYHAQWKVSTSSNGIDVQSQKGANAVAVSDGEVSRVVAFPGYNNCIIIRHGGYYTFYGNIQTVSVHQGDKVSAGQSLGEVYTDPDTNVSQVHFQLWQGTTKLNPEPWIR